MRTQNIEISEEAIRDFCERNEIIKLSLFGSVLRDDFTPESDVDFLVELAPDARVGLLGFARIENELSDLLGRQADLSTPDELSPYFRDEVLAEAETVYVET